MALFVGAISRGASHRVASKAAGISHTTGQRWYADNEPFRAAVDAAQAGRVDRWLAVIERAADGDWKAAAWLLEHCDTEEYGKSVKTAVQEEIQSFLNGLKGKLGSNAWKEVLLAASEHAGGAHAASRGAPERPGAEH